MSKKSITLTEARANLKTVMDEVCKKHAPTITRQDGEPVVMVSLADYNSVMETLYLLGNANNARHLMESMTQLKAGRGAVRQFCRRVIKKYLLTLGPIPSPKLTIAALSHFKWVSVNPTY